MFGNVKLDVGTVLRMFGAQCWPATVVYERLVLCRFFLVKAMYLTCGCCVDLFHVFAHGHGLGHALVVGVELGGVKHGLTGILRETYDHYH